MRIGINTRFLIKDRLEGIGWYTYQVVKRIVLNHPEHEYLFFFDRDPDPGFIFNSSVKPIILYPPARHPFLWYLWFEHALPAALAKHKVNVFLSPDGFGSLNTSIPQYIVVHDLAYLHFPNHIPFWVRSYYKYFVPKHLAKANHLFAVSNATKTDLIKQFKISPEKISIAYNGVREEFVPLDKEEINIIKKKYTEDRDYFLFVGAIHPRKNIANLIRAFDIFKKEHHTSHVLLIAGRKAWQTLEINTVLRESEFKSDIIHLDYCDTQLLSKLTGAAFCAINPSYFEGFGVPVLEALSCNVPVIVSERSSLPEVGGPGAILIQPENPQSIADAMVKVINDPNRLQRIHEGSIHMKKFNWDQTAEHIFDNMLKPV